MTSSLEFVDSLLRAWNEPDPSVRLPTLRAFMSDATRYSDPDDDVRGPAELDAVMTRVRQNPPPGAAFRAVGPVARHHDVVHFRWQLELAGAVLATGRDVLLVDGNEVRRVIGLFD